MAFRKKKTDDIKDLKNKKKSENKEFMVITYIFLAMFAGLMGYFVYFNVFVSEDVISSSYNSRQNLFADEIIRGSILTSDGVVVAETLVSDDGTETRNYPYANVFAHIIGYSSNGKSGIESLANFSLLRSHAPILEKIVNDFKEEKNTGDNVITTLDYDVQEAAYEALGSFDGAVIAIEPSTGEIIAMVSKPDFDPNTIEDEWDSIISEDSSDSVLLNRATQGLYPPGSTFKILTLLEYLQENDDAESYSFTCEGSLTVDDSTISCYNNTVHGTVNLMSSFAHSCNTSFSNIGLTLDLGDFSDLCESFLFNSELPYELPYEESSFVLGEDASTAEIMQTAIGQGETQVTPLHMALIAAAIANDGELMEPMLIESTENYQGVEVKSYDSTSYGSIMSKEDAQTLQTYMEDVVTEGTAQALNGQSYTAAGKTGSAEYGTIKGQSHAWFVGYASEGDKELAIAVIAEGAGAGSTYAVPIAKTVFDTYFSE